MGLETYHRKRDFSATPEPAGEPHVSDPARLSFVVQKHAARRLHYDFRLELDGVLLSWAVPKGPSVDPEQKRLAVRTEDHPIEYGGFEGTIPEGEYGGGTVMLWDRGRWIPEGDPHRGLKRGRLVFSLEGERLHGAWRLVRTGGDEWLLMKQQDEVARGAEPVERFTTSVASARTMEAIAASGDRTWTRGGELPTLEELGALEGARRRRVPATLAPAVATLVDEPPRGPGWLHELELEGYRAIGVLSDGTATLRSGRGADWTERLRPIALALEALPIRDAILDGEVVAFDREGRTSRDRLREVIDDRPDELVYEVFDLASAGGVDLRAVPLQRRKEVLARIVGADTTGRLRYVEHVPNEGADVLEAACELGVRGIVSKRADSRYGAGATDRVVARCAGHDVIVSNPDKVLYPEIGLTKGALARWVSRMAPWLLPHVADRPLALVRCPEGHTRSCFFQKHRGHAPDAVLPVSIPGDERPYLRVRDAAGLVGLVQMGVLEIHPWGARADRLDRPDRVVFDLDPDAALAFDVVVAAAREVHDRLERMGLRSFVRWSGGKGLHVVVPIGRRRGWDEVKAFSRGLAEDMVRADPGAYVAKATKAARTGKVFVDWLRNAMGATSIATWSMRARPGAPVAVPLRWDELDDLDLDPFTVREVRPPEVDPWEGFAAVRQSIPVDRLHSGHSGGIRNDHGDRAEDDVPRAWTERDERQYQHVLQSEREAGRSEERAKEIAARTVDRQRTREGRTAQQRRRRESTPRRAT